MRTIIVFSGATFIRLGFKAILGKDRDNQIIAECSNEQQLSQAVQQHSPDIVIMEIGPRWSATLALIETFTQLSSAPKIIAVSALLDTPLDQALAEQGIDATVPLDQAAFLLTSTVQTLVMQTSAIHISQPIRQLVEDPLLLPLLSSLESQTEPATLPVASMQRRTTRHWLPMLLSWLFPRLRLNLWRGELRLATKSDSIIRSPS